MPIHRSILHLAAPVALVAATLTGCTASTSDRDLVYKRPSELVEIASTPVGPFGAGRLPKVLWLDPRSPARFAEGHVPEATNIPFPDIEPTHEATCRGFDLFIVYDTDYDDVLSRAASKRLLELGYENVYSMLGGLKAWKADGYPVATSRPAETSAQGAASPAPAAASSKP